MKKLIGIEIVFCLLCFIINWYQNYIISYFNIFTLIILKLALYISMVTLLIFYFKNFKNNIKKYLKIISLILILVSFFFLHYDFKLIKTKIELSLYEKERSIIIEKVKNNEFSYYYDKNIKLPIYKSVSSDGEIYVYQNDDNQVISFWIFRGVLSGSTELIYTSTDEKLIYENKSRNLITKIIKLKEHWYYIETDY